MAQTPLTLSTEKSAAIKQHSSARSQSASTHGGSSFAAMMAREQNGADKASTKSTQAAEKSASAKSSRVTPMVARLPENNGFPLNRSALAGRTPSDLARLQNFNKARTDLQQTRNMDNLMQSLAGGASTLDIARNMGVARNLRTIAANNNGKGFELCSTDFIRTRTSHVSGSAKSGRSRSRKKLDDTGLGKLSARFESGSDGIAAIGYDSTGGTSYGKYQIASRVGSMKSFLSFLDSEAPDLASRLRKSGPANTGSRQGGMPSEWRAIAREQPERFEQLQEAFIHASHYQPALEAIEKSTGLDTSSLSAAMREVIWSTAVQHGPAGAARIFARADDMSGKQEDASYERKLISNVYNVRAGQFGSSTSQVRQAVKNRFRQERQLALNMLESPGRATLA